MGHDRHARWPQGCALCFSHHWADGQHRARGGADHALGDAAHQQIAETGAPMGGHDDPIHLLGNRGLKNFLVRHAYDDLTRDLGRWA
jgi:hypothetical protein